MYIKSWFKRIEDHLFNMLRDIEKSLMSIMRNTSRIDRMADDIQEIKMKIEDLENRIK